MKRHLIILLLLFLALSAAGETEVPDTFIYRGGSGRVALTCPDYRLEDSEAFARICFDSPNYTRILVNGTEYATQQEGKSSFAEIPVPLNRSFDIQATTTAMSQPHDITYTLYIGVDALSDGNLPGLRKRSVTVPRYAKGFAVAESLSGGYLSDVAGQCRSRPR